MLKAIGTGGWPSSVSLSGGRRAYNQSIGSQRKKA
jgi:hypothetical protein